MTLDVLALLLANACLLAAGAGITRAFGAWRRPDELARVLGTSYLAGVAAFGVAAQLLYVLGLSLDLPQALVLCAALAAVGALPSVRDLSRDSPAGGVEGRSGQALPFVRLELLALLLVAIPLLLLAADAAYQPLASWDAWAQWTAKARGLVLLGGLDPAAFAGTAYADWHPDYPLLVPALEAFTFRFIGLDSRIIHLEFWLLLVGFVATLIEFLRPRVGGLLAWSSVLAIVWTPKIGAETLSANADLPLAVFLVLAGVAAWRWVFEQDAGSLGLLGIFGAAALATKLEGLVELAIVLAAALALAARRSRRLAWTTAGAGAATLVGIVPWRIWTMLNEVPVTYSPGSVFGSLGSIDPTRVPISGLLLVRQLFDPAAWLLLVPLAVLALALAATRPGRRTAVAATGVLLAVALATALIVPPHSYPWRTAYWLLLLPAAGAGVVVLVEALRRGGTPAFVASSIAAMFVALVGTYLFTPFAFAWQLGTSSSRIVLPLGLFAAAFTPLVLQHALTGLPDGSGATRPRAPGGP